MRDQLRTYELITTEFKYVCA